MLRDVLILLGSGASVPFGPLTMSKLSDLFEENLRLRIKKFPSVQYKDMFNLYKSIKDTIYGYADIESIFSVIEHLSKNIRYYELGHTASYLLLRNTINASEQITSDSQKQLAKKLLTIFKNFVRKKCTIKPSEDDHIYAIFNDLFTKLADKYSHSNIKGDDGKMYGYPCCTVYSTNYDLVQEMHWQGGVHINDLWVNRSGLEVLDVNKKEGEVMELIKLHGSLNWFKLEGGEVVKLESYRRKFGKRRVRGEVMIFPIYQKDLYLYPWFDLFKRFKDDLKNTRNWVAIGYNFNDEFIRNIILEVLGEGGHKLIIVSPTAHNVVKDKFKGFKGSVRGIRARLGEDQTASLIVDKL